MREGKTISCSDTATEARFDVSWRSLYLGVGIHSVQSTPVFSFNRNLLVPLSWHSGSHMLPSIGR